jgi:predicted O-methyltransferase YrrM
MSKRFNKIITYLRNEGPFRFIRLRFRRHILSFFLMPIYLILLRIKKFKSLESAIDFIFEKSHNYFQPIQIKSEASSLLHFIETKKPKIIMEIGTAFGGMLFLFAQAAQENSLIISIDLPGGNFGAGYPWWKIPLYKAFGRSGQKIFLLRADSHLSNTYRIIENILQGNKIDFLFIDGDHSYEGVKKDFEMYSKLVNSRGIIAFHDIISNTKNDYSDPTINVDMFWKEIKDKFKYQEFVENYNQNKAGIGVLELE